MGWIDTPGGLGGVGVVIWWYGPDNSLIDWATVIGSEFANEVLLAIVRYWKVILCNRARMLPGREMSCRRASLALTAIFAPRNQHRNPIDNRIGAATCCADQPGFFETKITQARWAGQPVEHGWVKSKGLVGIGRHRGSLLLNGRIGIGSRMI